jgi:hypothetical protein
MPVTPRDVIEYARQLWHPGSMLTARVHYRYSDVLGSHEHGCSATWYPDTEQWALPPDLPNVSHLEIVSFTNFTTTELPD